QRAVAPGAPDMGVRARAHPGGVPPGRRQAEQAARQASAAAHAHVTDARVAELASHHPAMGTDDATVASRGRVIGLRCRLPAAKRLSRGDAPLTPARIADVSVQGIAVSLFAGAGGLDLGAE